MAAPDRSTSLNTASSFAGQVLEYRYLSPSAHAVLVRNSDKTAPNSYVLSACRMYLKNKLSPLASTTFTLTDRDWKNTVIHGDDGKIMYWIETDRRPRSSSSQYSDDSTSSNDSRNPTGTIVYRATARGRKELVASFDFNIFDTSSIHYEGATRSIEEMFPKENSRSS